MVLECSEINNTSMTKRFFHVNTTSQSLLVGGAWRQLLQLEILGGKCAVKVRASHVSSSASGTTLKLQLFSFVSFYNHIGLPSLSSSDKTENSWMTV